MQHFRLMGLLKALLFLFASSLLFAEEYRDEIKMAAPHITSLIEADGKGYYQRIMQQALKPLPQLVSQQYYPYKRALLMFEQGRVNCIYSFTKVMENKLGKENIISSYPLGAFAYYVFSPKDVSAVHSLSEILNKRVGGTIGHDEYYRHRLPEGTNLSLLDKDQQNLQLLKLGRLDYLIGALPDLSPYLSELNYDANLPLIESYDRITCHAGDGSAEFISLLSAQLKQLKEGGVYQALAPDLYLDFDAD